MDKEKLITDITKLALDFWTMNLHNGTFESNLRTLIDKHEEAINYSQCCETLKGKHTQTFDEFMTGICKNRGITLINNYTKETVGFDTLIEKWKATNT